MSEFNQIKYQNDYIAENYDRVNLTLPKGEKERIKELAKEKGLSLNEYIRSAVEEFSKK